MDTPFESLPVWHDARALANAIYRITKSGEFSLDWALRDQIRRSAISVVSNIAEGHERGGQRQFAHFLTIAKGSCGELRAQLYTAQDAGYLTASVASELRSLASMLSRQLSGMRASALKGAGR